MLGITVVWFELAPVETSPGICDDPSSTCVSEEESKHGKDYGLLHAFGVTSRPSCYKKEEEPTELHQAVLETRQSQLSGGIGLGNPSFGLCWTIHAGKEPNQCVPAKPCGYDSSLRFLTVEKDGKLEVLPLNIGPTPTYNAFYNVHHGARALRSKARCRPMLGRLAMSWTSRACPSKLRDDDQHHFGLEDDRVPRLECTHVRRCGCPSIIVHFYDQQ